MNRPKHYTPPPAGIPNQILNSAAHDNRPDGVSLLDSMTHEYEKTTGRKSVLPSATIAKLQNKLTTAQLAEAQRLIKNGNGIHKQADARLAIELLAEALEIIAAKPAATAAPAPAKATTAPNPAAPAVSKTPLADQLAKLDGIERTEFFNANSRALRIEGMKAAVPGTITPAK